ncbi:hypothetical protein [Nocardia otitidiscaviarum]|uniref:hypothetical protein n=1 Tax=Nocardia otitidiscaviarum TaxID=1823 RepID=UPI001E519FC2|nr:hypothetical protein [Nocardia otitidiscaviarum]
MADRMRRALLDRLLPVAVERAGAPGGLRFTERQLYYELCRVMWPRLPRWPLFTVPTVVSYPAFRSALRRYGEIPGLLTCTPSHPRPAGRHTPEPDLFDYGLPRLLVAESDAVAQMLRANGVPMESACPVLSAAELPLDTRVVDMLARASGTIYLLHDANPAGLTFPARFTAGTEVPPGVRVVPLGLRPRQAGALHLAHHTGPTPDMPAPHLDSWERAWLRRGRSVDVEAVRPAALLRTVHRLVRAVRPPRSALTELRTARSAGFLTWPAT